MDMVHGYGPDIWSRYMGQEYGPDIWFKNMVQIYRSGILIPGLGETHRDLRCTLQVHLPLSSPYACHLLSNPCAELLRR